jgi:carboxylesterase type B
LKSWNLSDATSTIKRAVHKSESYLTEIISTYELEENIAQDILISVIVQLGTDATFSHIPYKVASNHRELSVSIYMLDVPDTADRPLSGAAYHGWDITFFFRLPTVAGQAARSENQITANSFCESAITLAYGEQPWQPFITNNMIMSFTKDGPRLTKSKVHQRWQGFMKTKEDKCVFENCGNALIFAALSA